MNFAAVRKPVSVNNLRVILVSSHARISAFCSHSAARGDKSPRLPIGVAMTTNCPALCVMILAA